MYDEEEPRRYGDATRLEPIVEQHDEEMLTSPTSSVSLGTSYLEDERRAREEIRQFEELEQELATTQRRGVRVKFDADDDRLTNMAQTTVIRTEPYFHVNACEDQVTKHFYQNEYQWKKEKYEQIVPKTPSELDSLDDEYLLSFEKPVEIHEETRRTIFDRATPSPTKSILKKTHTRDRISVPQSDSGTRSRSPSPASPKKRPASSTHSESNEVEYLASVTAKETSTSSHPSCRRSLFEPTINIFDPSNGPARRPSRLRYYIKPYRGETYIRPSAYPQHSRSHSEQRASQSSEPTVWYTFSNQYHRPLTRRQHVSWSPVREYIHRGREKTGGTPTKKRETFVTPLSTRSSSNPCLRSSSPSMIPIPMRYRSPQAAQLPRPSFPLAAPMDIYETASMTNYSLTPNSQPEIQFSSFLPDNADSKDTIQRYDRLLEKMRATDEQLKLLSQSWKSNTPPKAPTQTSVPLTKVASTKTLISPALLQMCLIILLIFNLLAVYYFNEINVFWSRFVTNQVALTEQTDDESVNF